jgi:hypothetical protein
MDTPESTWEYHAVIRRHQPKRNKRPAIMAAALSSMAVVAVTPFSVDSAELQRFNLNKLPQLENNVSTVLPLAPVVIVKPKRITFKKDDTDGKSFQSLNSYYVGKARLQIDWSDVDLTQNLRYMWERKVTTQPVTPAVRKSVAKIITRYEQSEHRTTTLPAFTKRVDHIVNDARSNLDFTGLCARYRLSSDRCVRLQYLSGRITGRTLIAYGMTELFPSQDGETNRKMLDMMLRRAGEDYINSIPALGDKYLSMGFYQFTSFAVRHDADGVQGASVVSMFAGRDRKIAGSVMQLSGDDQHRAAFYFAVYNLAVLLMEPKYDDKGKLVRSGLTAKQYASLKAHSPISEADLTVFMAASHHLPGGARRATASWLQEGCKRPLRDYLRGDLPMYGKKSMANLEALI